MPGSITSRMTASNGCLIDQQHTERAFTVGHNRRLVSLRFEIEPQAFRNVLLVFDDQDPTHDTTRLERNATAALPHPPQTPVEEAPP